MMFELPFLAELPEPIVVAFPPEVTGWFDCQFEKPEKKTMLFYTIIKPIYCIFISISFSAITPSSVLQNKSGNKQRQ